MSSTMRCGSNDRTAASASRPEPGGLDREALEAQRHRDDVDDVRLVVDDEDAVLVGGRGGVHGDIVGTNPGKLLRVAACEARAQPGAVNVGRIAPRAIAFAERLKPT